MIDLLKWFRKPVSSSDPVVEPTIVPVVGDWYVNVHTKNHPFLVTGEDGTVLVTEVKDGWVQYTRHYRDYKTLELVDTVFDFSKYNKYSPYLNN
jgi:hypothetical protein